MTIKLIANRYKILEELGQGGMAIVYKAYDARLEREVAVKVIRQDVFPPDELEHILKRFEREAKSLGRLSHPNIVTILDYGNQDGVPYLVMEYIPGKSLRERIAARENQRMDWHEAAQLLIPIAEALEYAHQRHVVHRDIKPGNILVTETGQVMLVDFGIAKILASEENSRLTSTGAIVGTPDYMAPEQVSNIGVDHRSDIYSLGVVFYELVTGRKPFQGPTPISTLMKHVSEPLPSPKQFVPGLSDGVERIISKALAKRREDRYQSMAAFTAALASGQENEITQDFIPVSDMSDEETRDIFFESSKPKIGSQLRQRMRLWIAIALGGLIFLGCVSAMTIFRTPLLTAIFPPTPTATATFTPTPTQTQTLTVTLTPSMTLTPTPLPSQTPTASFTPLPSATPTSSSPMLYIDHTSFCRTGPGGSYPDVADFVSGVILPILGTNNQGWWLVEIDLPMLTKLKSCWIYGNIPMGNWRGVQIIIPTP